MRLLFLFGMFLLPHIGWTQFRQHPSTVKYEIPKIATAKTSSFSIFGLLSDPIQTFKYQSPALAYSYNLTDRDQSSSSWISSVTSQSYGNGKFGTYYYWDVQGNLQGTRGFIDISGKNKRGLKLLFPWR
jgi:hypothetical protein